MNKISLIILVLTSSFIICQEKEPNYLNPNLSTNERIDDLLSRMTLREKVGQMDQFLAPSFVDKAPWGGDVEKTKQLLKDGLIGSLLFVTSVKEANEIQRIAEQTKLKIPVLIGIDAIHGHALYSGATVFPTEVGLAATWNPKIVKRAAEITAEEMRLTGYHWTFSPNIDIVRDPRWGRSGETFGEDSYLVAEMGVAMIKGYQGTSLQNKNSVLACAKHFVAGGQPGNGINFSPMEVSERMLRSEFFPPFEKAVNAGVQTFMAAHNEVNGIPCHAWKKLQTDILKNEWGFDGFIVSDWLDMEALYEAHKITESKKEAFKIGINTGIDMHMYGEGFAKPVVELVEHDALDEAKIDQAVKKILRTKFELGLFENRYVEEDGVNEKLATIENIEVALQTALESITLLKNKNDLLPLENGKKKIFISGPNANHHGSIVGDWVGEQPEENIITPIEGIKKIVKDESQIEYYKCRNIVSILDEDITIAAQKASENDIAILFVGGNNNRTYKEDRTGGENVARSNIDLYGKQIELVKAVVATGTPTIVVLINGRPLATPWIAENVDAIIETWEPGMQGGTAIAKVLFGEYNPGGKLPFTIPRSVGHLQSWYNHKPTQFMHQYKFNDNSPLYEFGFGLSYTTFEYDTLIVENAVPKGGNFEVSVSLRNSGKRSGDEVVQIFINDVVSSVTTPVKKLVAFRRVNLKPKETKTITFKIDQELLALYNIEMKKVVEPGLFQIFTGDLVSEFNIYK